MRSELLASLEAALWPKAGEQGENVLDVLDVLDGCSFFLQFFCKATCAMDARPLLAGR